MITLETALQTAQDSLDHHPILEIVSAQKSDDIPFDGTFLTSETFSEFGVNLIPHSSGRLCIAYCYGPDADGDSGIKYVYTDTERREFTPVTIELYTDTSRVMVSVSICEMADGNIGIVCLVNDIRNDKYRLLRRIVTVEGLAVSNAEIANWSHDTYTSDPWVSTIDINSYLMVYGKKSDTNYFLYMRTSSDFITWSTESVMQVDADSKGVGLLTITDSACVEDTGTYALIFTGASVTPAAGTYTVGRYVSALNIVDQLCTETNGAHDLIFTGTYTTTAIGTYTITRYVSALNIVTAACTAADGTYNLIFTGTYTTAAAGTYTVLSNTIIATNLTNPGAGYAAAPTVATRSGHGGSITADILPKIVSTSIINGGSGYSAAPTVATQSGEGTITADVLPIIESTVITDKGSGYIVNPTCVTQTGDGAIRADISAKRLANPSILKISTGDLWLWFDVLESTGPGGEQLTNIYYSVSTNGGTTWTAEVRVTNYDGYGEVGGHPVAVQKASNQMNLIFARKVGALHMDDTATGWPTGDATVELSWDSTNRKLYAVNIDKGSMQCVVKIDVDTWTVDQYWDATTTPGFPAVICGGSSPTEPVWPRNHVHDGHIIAITAGRVGSSGRWLWVLDGEANTITNYYCDTNVANGFTQNVTHSISAHYETFYHCQVDAANLRVYLCLVDSYVWHPKVSVGYIDLTESSPEFHEIFNYTDIDDAEARGLSYSNDGGMWVDVDSGYIVLSCSTGMWTGAMLVFDLETGALIVKWTGSDIDFPYYGLTKPFVYNGKIYAGMCKYTSGYDQSGFRGLAEIDISAETITLHRPSYCSNDDHYFGRPSLLQDGRIAMTHTSYGVAVFDTISKTWSLFSNNNIAGFTADGKELASPSQIAYDDTNDMIMVGDAGVYGGRNPQGVIMFSSNGYIRQASYAIGTNPGGGWSFFEAGNLVQGFLDYDAAAAVEPGTSTSAYVFWTHEDTEGEKSIKWDKDGSSLDLSEYLIDEEIVLERTIDGNPATLSFSVSHGHLFDPYNQNSLLSIYLKKGRKLTIRWGELISGTEYWQNAGTFYVQSGSIKIARGEYPIMKIEALDQRALWQHSHVYATDIYSNTAAEILTDLMTDIADMSLAEIDTLTIDGDQTFDHQWIETTLDEILTQVCNRVGYYYRFTVDGKFSVRKITDSATVDHTYTDQTKIIQYSPDDKYSDFTNRVTVTGQERDFTAVTFAEERVTGVSGTIGFWGHGDKKTVWFAPDKSRRVINPRLVVIDSAVGIGFRLAGSVDEELEECPPGADYKYCVVKTSCQDLRVPLMVNITSAMALSAVPDLVLAFIAGVTIPIGRICQQIAMTIVAMILGSAINYQYDIFGNPLGSIRRSVQGQVDDEEHQAEIGCVVEQKFEDPLCYSAADCFQVAAFELMVAKMQRKRIAITKIAHLQDEDGDTIRFVHPYSGADIDLYVTNIRRKFKKGQDGYFIDEIDGVGGEPMRTYGGRLINSKVRREITNRQELRDAIVWDVYPVDKYCRVKIQGTDKYVKAHYNENWGSTPEWLKPGNAVRISHPGGNKGRIEVVGHGILIPTAIPGGSVTLPAVTLTDAVLTGMAVMAPNDGGMTAWVYTGTYRIDGTTYTFSGMTMDNATIEMDRPDLFIDEVGGSVSIEAAHATLFRYDLIVVGTDGVLDVVKGSNYSGEPTFPAVPADHVQCGWVLIYPRMTSITQFDISNYYSGAQEGTLSVVLSDNDLSWGQHNFKITISFVDQYRREVEGDYHCTIKIMPFGTGDLYARKGAATSDFLPSSVSDPTPGVKAWAVNFTDHATITYTREDGTTGAPPVATYSESSGYIVVEETTTESIAMKEYTLRDALGNVLQIYGTSV